MAAADKLFNYCERGQDPGFWAEPVNAVTNLAFVVAGIAVWWLLLRRPPGSRPVSVHVLAVLLLTIGLGSFLFHTLATRWSAAADVLPIVIFMFVYLYVALRRLFDLGRAWAWTALGGYLIVMIGAGAFEATTGIDLNGSSAYVPALLVMLLMGGLLSRRGHEATHFVSAAGLVFAASLTFRTIDPMACDTIAFGGRPLGTHFLWHCLNGLTLFLLTRALIPRSNDDSTR